MCGRLAVSVVDDLPNLFAVVAKRARTSASWISAALATFITFPLQLSALSLSLSLAFASQYHLPSTHGLALEL